MRILLAAASEIIRQNSVGVHVSGRFFRLFIESSNFGGYTEIAELEFLNRDGLDIFDGDVPFVEHSDAYDGSNYGTAAIDNNPNTRWAASGNYSKWLKFTFQEAVDLYGLAIKSLAPGMGAYANRAIKDFRLEISDNGVNWTVVKRWTDEVNWVPAETRTYML